RGTDRPPHRASSSAAPRPTGPPPTMITRPALSSVIVPGPLCQHRRADARKSLGAVARCAARPPPSEVERRGGMRTRTADDLLLCTDEQLTRRLQNLARPARHPRAPPPRPPDRP